MENGVRLANPLLYPGEVLDTVAGFPTIYHYTEALHVNGRDQSHGQSPKPLIVCVAGGLHLARVFYGGHKGSIPRDFLAYWLSTQGFGVLSLSYPLETGPEIMPSTASGYRIQDWGRQAALTTKKVIEEQHLETRSVVLISWSMGGRMVVPYNISCKELGLDVQQYIGFSATPGISSIRPLPPGMTCSSAGYFSLPSHMGVFCQQLKEMESLNGGHESIPRDVYLREYTGATPINLIGLRLKYDCAAGQFIQDDVPHEEDTRVWDVASYPFMTAMYPQSILDASHALADRATWGFLLTYKLESMIGGGLKNLHRQTEKWQKVLEMVHSAPERLSVSMRGNHFFFVGEESAAETARAVVNLLDDALKFQRELCSLAFRECTLI